MSKDVPAHEETNSLAILWTGSHAGPLVNTRAGGYRRGYFRKAGGEAEQEDSLHSSVPNSQVNYTRCYTVNRD